MSAKPTSSKGRGISGMAEGLLETKPSPESKKEELSKHTSNKTRGRNGGGVKRARDQRVSGERPPRKCRARMDTGARRVSPIRSLAETALGPSGPIRRKCGLIDIPVTVLPPPSVQAVEDHTQPKQRNISSASYSRSPRMPSSSQLLPCMWETSLNGYSVVVQGATPEDVKQVHSVNVSIKQVAERNRPNA